MMKKMQLFEPAMCCETGLCGVSIDPELLRISTLLHQLKQAGVVVDRFNLNNAPMEFVNNQTINRFLNEKGVEALPAVMLDGELLFYGRYPGNEEILELLGLPTETLSKESAQEDQCCCNEGDGCC